MSIKLSQMLMDTSYVQESTDLEDIADWFTGTDSLWSQITGEPETLSGYFNQAKEELTNAQAKVAAEAGNLYSAAGDKLKTVGSSVSELIDQNPKVATALGAGSTAAALGAGGAALALKRKQK